MVLIIIVHVVFHFPEKLRLSSIFGENKIEVVFHISTIGIGHLFTCLGKISHTINGIK